MVVNTVMVRKPIDHENFVKDQFSLIYRMGAKIEKVNVDTVVEVSSKQFEDFKKSMLEEYDFIAGHEKETFILKVKGSANNTGFVISPEGSSYARYVGSIIEDAPMFDCANCGHSFVGQSAISRKDNSSKVCSKCATQEAIQDFSHQDILKYCKDVLQPASNSYNVKIIVQSPDGFEKILTPQS